MLWQKTDEYRLAFDCTTSEDASFIAPCGSGAMKATGFTARCGFSGVVLPRRLLFFFGRSQAHEFLKGVLVKPWNYCQKMQWLLLVLSGAFFFMKFLTFLWSHTLFWRADWSQPFWRDASRSWSLGVLLADCSHGTSPAMAVPGNGGRGGLFSRVSWKQWKRLTGCNGCWKPGWLMCCGIWNVWSQGENDTRSLLQKYTDKISCWS